ncbi:MAG: transposase, partial [Acidobacteria bacterium]|nr:transposase [Acidobacteriota bacterium]
MPSLQLALALVYLVHDSLRILLTLILALIAPAWAQARAEARHLFVAHQLALYHAREAPRKPTTPAFRLTMVFLSRLFDWRHALLIVRPETLVRWHRDGFKSLWRRKSRPKGRPPVPPETVALIRQIARDNIAKGQGEIAALVLLELGLRLSPRTIKKYIRQALLPPRNPAGRGDQRWASFVRNHAKVIVAMDFFTVVSATFRTYYGLVIMEIGTRKILHTNVTASPTADWVCQQLRDAIPCDHAYRFLIHDRAANFNGQVDKTIKGFGMRPLKTPYRAPKANAHCERLIGTIRRDCLDYLIPFSQNHLRLILREYVAYYNHHRPHGSLGPGIPDPAEGLPV